MREGREGGREGGEFFGEWAFAHYGLIDDALGSISVAQSAEGYLVEGEARADGCLGEEGREGGV